MFSLHENMEKGLPFRVFAFRQSKGTAADAL